MKETDLSKREGHIETGAEYLKRIGEEYVTYKQFLPGLSDKAFQYQKELNVGREIGVESFLADFAIAAEDRRRNLVRWRMGEKLPKLSEEKIAAIKSALPKFVVLNKEAVGGMRVEPARRHKIDIVVEDIMSEIAQRLPRTLDAYRYYQDYAQDSVDIPGIGKIDVKLHQTEGVFSTISEIKSKNFRVWNCRDSGVIYLDRFNEISRPTTIEIKPENIELKIHSDGSGIEQRDHRKFKEMQDTSVVWLVDKVLNPIKKTPIKGKQIDIPLMEEPFPEEKIGPLFAFVEMEDLERIDILKDDISRAYPDERFAVKPSRRLIPLNYSRGNLPELVHDGFLWCGVGRIDRNTDLKNLTIADRERCTWGIGGSKEGTAEVKPLTATDIYIADWQAWDDYRKKAFKPGHDELTYSEVSEMYQAVGKTLVPVTEYRKNYQKPVVLIARDLEVNEIGKIYFPPEEKRL